MALLPGFKVLAEILQEAAQSITHSNVRSRLSDAIQDAHKGTGKYAYYVDHTGDGETGDVIYSSDQDLKKAPYTLGEIGGKKTANVDTEKAKSVVPTTTYDEEADDDDHMTAMEAAKLYTAGPKFYERFISKGERDKADSGSFAGKGKSFPILKPGDVSAAVHAMGRAGSSNYGPAQLKANIIRIAKAKGWESELPDAWKDGSSDSSEAADVQITGDVIPLREGAVGQDGTAYLKLIAPGRGSSGYYPSEVLKRDGPKVFAKGTKNFWNHQTDAEESARPEGDLRDLASVLTEDAHWEDNGPAGAGLYARAKVFENFRQPVDDLAKHIGMSIRAAGKAKEGKAPDGKTGPIIEQLTRGISVDYVTTPGAGGQILQLFEAARSRNIPTSEVDMDEAAVKRLIESSVSPLKLENARLREQLNVLQGPQIVGQFLADYNLPPASKQAIVKRIVESGLDLSDDKKLKAAVQNEALEQARFLESLGYGSIKNLGAPPVTTDPKEIAALEAAGAERFKESMDELADCFLPDGASKEMRKAFRKGRAA